MEKTKQKLYDFSKKILFDIVPESIEIFDKDDVAYFIFSEFSDFILKNINHDEKVNKTIKVIDKLIAKEEEQLETMIVIQVFQKIYPLEDKVAKFRKYLSGNTLDIFEKYLIEYNKPVYIHPSLRNPMSEE